MSDIAKLDYLNFLNRLVVNDNKVPWNYNKMYILLKI